MSIGGKGYGCEVVCRPGSKSGSSLFDVAILNQVADSFVVRDDDILLLLLIFLLSREPGNEDVLLLLAFLLFGS